MPLKKKLLAQKIMAVLIQEMYGVDALTIFRNVYFNKRLEFMKTFW